MANVTLPIGRSLLLSIHRWLVGACLVLVIGGVLFANALIFSARSFQHNFAQVSGSPSGVVSMAMIRETSRAIAVWEAESAPIEARVAESERALDAANARLDQMAGDLNAGADALSKRVAEGERRAAISPDLSDRSLPALESRISRLENANRAERRAAAPLREALAPLKRLQGDIAALSAEREARQGETNDLSRQLVERRARILAQGPFKGNFDQIKAEIDSLARTGPSGLGLTLAQTHPSFLSVLLACSMGALGAILFLFPAYAANRPEWRVTFVTIVVRMAFGAMTGFTLFLLANALIAAFGFSSAMAGGPSLNPFAVSGLGIVAGLMSDHAAQWVFERGTFLYSGAGMVGRSAARLANSAAGPIKSALGPRKGGFGPVNPHGGPEDPAG